MKRFVSVLLAAVLALGLIVSAPAEGAKEEPMKITWVAYQTQSIKDDALMIQHYNEVFNVDIDVWNLDNSSVKEQYGLWFASDQIPDFMANGFSAADFGNYARQGVLAEIPEDLLKEHLPNTIAKLEAVSPGCTDYGIINGVRYGFPREINFHNQFRGPLVYRGDWMEAVGVDKAPETLEEFEALMYKFAKEDPDGNGADDTYGLSRSGLDPVFGAFGYVVGGFPEADGIWVEIDGSLQFAAIQPAVKDALATLAKWYKDGVLAPDFITGENNGGYWAISHAFTEGLIGFTGHGAYYHWHGEIGVGENHNPAALEAVFGTEAADKITFGQPFMGPGGAITKGSPMYNGNNVAFGVQLEEDPAKMAKIMDIVEYFAGDTPERFIEGFLGLKDVMWTYDDNGVPYSFEQYVGNLSQEGAHTVLNPIQMVHGYELLYKYRYDWAVEHDFNIGDVMYSELLVALPSAGTYMTELNKIRDEAFIAIITGTQDVNSFDAFVEEWKANGGDVLTQEANDWWQSR